VEGADGADVRRSAVVLAASLIVLVSAVAGLPAVGSDANATNESANDSDGLVGGTVGVQLLQGSGDDTDERDARSDAVAEVSPGDPPDLQANESEESATNGTDTDGDGLVNAIENATGTDPFAVDSDHDGLDDDRELALGTDPTVADTDGDGLADGREVAIGTDPLVADTDDDGLDDDRELEAGTDPLVADTDDDGLADGRELDVGTDPLDPDTDGDRLLDGWEVRNETPDGVELPGSDPLSKDLYVQVDYAAGIETADPSFYAGLRAEFSQMPVDNPDNTTGIDLHVREGGHLNESVTFTGENFWSLKDGYYEQRLGPRAGVYHQVVVSEFDANYVGYGEVGGRFSMVAAGASTETRQYVVVHELLHNVVGEVDAPGACENDPKHYCEGGYLGPTVSPDEGAYLPEPLAAQLETQGFAESEA
jgi:hypothetical protein